MRPQELGYRKGRGLTGTWGLLQGFEPTGPPAPSTRPSLGVPSSQEEEEPGPLTQGDPGDGTTELQINSNNQSLNQGGEETEKLRATG